MIKDLVTDKKHLFADNANTELRAQLNRSRTVVLVNGDLVNNVR